MESQKGRKIHGLALSAQERESFLEALKLEDEAMVAYQEDRDASGFSEIQAMRVLTLRHLYRKTGYKGYLLLARHSAEVGVEIAEESGLPEALAIPMHTLGKVYEDLEKWPEAAMAQQKAIDIMTNTPPASHNRLAFLAEIRLHLYADEYMAGDKEALLGLDEAIVTLENDTAEPRYNRDVWLSGGYMSKAKILKVDNLNEARAAMQKAKAVIDANTELTLRKQEWEKLSKEISA